MNTTETAKFAITVEWANEDSQRAFCELCDWSSFGHDNDRDALADGVRHLVEAHPEYRY